MFKANWSADKKLGLLIEPTNQKKQKNGKKFGSDPNSRGFSPMATLYFPLPTLTKYGSSSLKTSSTKNFSPLTTGSSPLDDAFLNNS